MEKRDETLCGILDNLTDRIKKSLLGNDVWSHHLSFAIKVDDLLLRLYSWKQEVQANRSLPTVEERSPVLAMALRLCLRSLHRTWGEFEKLVNGLRFFELEATPSTRFDNFKTLVIDLTSQADPIRSYLDEDTKEDPMQELQQEYAGKKRDNLD